MNTKLVIALVILPTLVLSGFAVAPSSALAACSETGFINSNGRCVNSFYVRPFAYPQYSYSANSIEQYIVYLQQLIQLLQDQVDNQVYVQSKVDVVTRSAVDIENNEATLRGRVDLNNQDEAEVYFEYGRTRTNLNEETRTLRIDDNDDDDFDITATGLRSDTVYYFRAVAEDEDGDEDYGNILSFRTDEGSNNDEPSVNTRSAVNITDDSADLRGTVDMNDFSNGRVFFVYGEDEDAVDDVADDYDTYAEVTEDGDDLQKLLVDNDLDGDDSYQEEAANLDSDTDIYFSLCVEYEDEDGDEQLVCGDTEVFVTDN